MSTGENMTSRTTAALVIRCGARLCAIAIHHVRETMRPLPVDSVAGAPDFVLGLAVIRGAPVPVVDLAAVLGGGEAAQAHRRFVTLRLEERSVALAVEEVVGVERIDTSRLGELPPLLGIAGADRIEALGTVDAQLLLVLRAAQLLPPDVWAALSDGGAPA